VTFRIEGDSDQVGLTRSKQVGERHGIIWQIFIILIHQ
jgi:hypothetical protein